LENIFVDTTEEKQATEDILNETQNSSLDDKEKMLTAVKQSQEKFKAELGDLFGNTWNSKIAEIKANIKSTENERKQANKG
jgi:hypothetical protein